MKVKCTRQKLCHCYFNQRFASNRPDDTTRVNHYHISHHAVISHLITLPIKLAQHCQTVWIQFFSFPIFSPMTMSFFSPLPYCHCSCSFVSSLSCLSRAALIKHGVGGGTESSSRAEEKGSNSTSQDGTVTHNGPAILSAPHRLPTESPLLRQLFNRPPLTQHTCMSTHKHTCTYATHWLLVRACMSLALQLTLLWAFWSAPTARRQPFHFLHHAEAQPLS